MAGIGGRTSESRNIGLAQIACMLLIPYCKVGASPGFRETEIIVTKASN